MIREYIKRCEWYSVIISVLMIVLSIFLMLNPLKSLEVFVIIFSIIMLINGIGYFVSYFTISSESRLFSIDLLMGLITIISGVMVLVYRMDLINIFPIILGIWIIVSNLFKLQLSINLGTIIGSECIWFIILSILLLVLGILLIVNPFESVITITTMAGLLLLISEAFNLIESIFILTKLK